MSLDFKKAFLSPFMGKGWLPKLTLITFILVTPAILHEVISFWAYVFITIPVSFIMIGYFVQFIHNEIYDIIPLLPQWKLNFKRYFNQGFKYTGLIFTYTGLLISVLFFTFFWPLEVLLKDYKSIQHMIFLITGIIFILTGSVFSQFLMCFYADILDFEECFNIKRIYKMFMGVKKEIIISILVYFLLPFVSVSSANFLLTLLYNQLSEITGNLTFLLTLGFLFSILLFYLASIPLLIFYNLWAQTYKIAKLMLNNKEQKITNN